MGERLFYLPSLFVIMLAAWGVVFGMKKLSQAKMPVLRVATAVAVAAACIAMGVRTYIRNQDWKDNLPLALATAHGNLDSSKACFWAGFVIASEAPEPWMRDFGAELLQR